MTPTAVATVPMSSHAEAKDAEEPHAKKNERKFEYLASQKKASDDCCYGFCSYLASQAEVIAQFAIQVLFITVVTFMAAALIPLTAQAVGLPIIAGATGLLAGNFFQTPSSNEPKAKGTPPGIKNTDGLDCCFNASAHFLAKNPNFLNWLAGFSPQMTVDEFAASFDETLSLTKAMTDFKAWLANQQQPQIKPVLELFATFLDTSADPKHKEAKNLYPKIRNLITVLQNYFKNYENAMKGTKWISNCNSNELRTAMHALHPKDIGLKHQLDAHEIIQKILGYLPSKGRIVIEKTAICEGGYEGSQKEEYDFIPLDMDQPLGKNLSLAALAENYYNYHEGSDVYITDPNNNSYKVVKCKRTFIEAPSSLCFQIKRFNQKTVEITDIKTLRDDSNQIEIQMKDGEKQLYLINSNLSLVKADKSNVGLQARNNEEEIKKVEVLPDHRIKIHLSRNITKTGTFKIRDNGGIFVEEVREPKSDKSVSAEDEEKSSTAAAISSDSSAPNASSAAAAAAAACLDSPSSNAAKSSGQESGLTTTIQKQSPTPVFVSTKRTEDVQIPEMIEIPLQNGRKALYQLVVTINHLGKEAHSGHYTAGIYEKNTAFLADDTKVRPLSQSEHYEHFSEVYLAQYKFVR
jgi:hypothetical protein